MKTYIPKISDIQRNWYLLDARGVPLGRVAARAAIILRGKHKRDYTANYDMGDFIVIINAGKIIYSGKKLDQKEYIHHTNYPGGIRRAYLKDVIKKNPNEPLKKAVYGMIPANHFKINQLKRLKIYTEENHKHTQHLLKIEI